MIAWPNVPREEFEQDTDPPPLEPVNRPDEFTLPENGTEKVQLPLELGSDGQVKAMFPDRVPDQDP